ncbi:MAG: hypothetical protein HYX71_11650 [Opitutae bacterium]|nr:hypothetical protein [Opitutae bacterium]
MKTTVRAFQREFPRMRKLAAAGKTVVIEAGGQTFEFRARLKTKGVLGFMADRTKIHRLPDGPIIPLAEWGDLAR